MNHEKGANMKIWDNILVKVCNWLKLGVDKRQDWCWESMEVWRAWETEGIKDKEVGRSHTLEESADYTAESF